MCRVTIQEDYAIRLLVPAVAGIAVATLPSAAQAINCARASSPIEHMICASQALLRADAAMNRAYIAILRVAPDPEIHAMLVSSQKRWVAARDKAFGGVDKAADSQTGESLSKSAQRRLILDAIESRTSVLAQMSKESPRQPTLIETALQQRRFATHFTGGPLAGFDTSCAFFRSDASGSSRDCECFASHYFQNNGRICSQTLDWATYRTYASRRVAGVIQGKPRLVATCNDDTCGDDDPSWLKTCLTDKQFPQPVSAK